MTLRDEGIAHDSHNKGEIKGGSVRRVRIAIWVQFIFTIKNENNFYPLAILLSLLKKTHATNVLVRQTRNQGSFSGYRRNMF